MRVSGSCGCSEDTSCYGCLRNYGNQFEHEHLIRGAAKEYLEWLLDSKYSAVIEEEKPEPQEMPDYMLKFSGDGQYQLSETTEEIWNNILDDCEDNEIEIVKEIAKRCSGNIAKPIYHESFVIAETGEKVYTDLIWPEQKVIFFLEESEEDYDIALKTGWSCYCTVKGMDINGFLKKIEVI